MTKFFYLLLCLLNVVFYTQGQHVKIPLSDIPNEGVSLSSQLQILEDKNHSLALEQVLGLPDSIFMSSENFKPKSNRSIFWLKTTVENQRTVSIETILKFNHLSHVTVYLVRADSVLEEAYGGEYSKASDRRVKDGRLYLQLELPQGSATQLYIKIKQRKNFAPILDFTFIEAEHFFVSIQKKVFFEALVFGSFGILFIYGLILYFGNKQRPYLWLSLTVIIKAIFFCQMIGYFTDFFMPDNPKFAWDMLVLLVYGSGMTSLLLVRDFLNLKKEHKKFNLIMNLFLVFLAIQGIIIYYIKYVYEDYLLGNSIGFTGYIPQGLFLVYMFIKLLPKIPKYKRPVIIGIIAFASLTLVTSVNFLLNLEKSYGQFTWNEVIGTLAFLVLYFFTLGQEMQLNEKEKNLALEKVNRITRNQKQELEKTVKERTNEVENSKQEIQIQNSQLTERNSQIEILLKEIHHRVKNNLQVVSSLLDLQSRSIEDKETLAVFTEGQHRVNAMALIHQKLYQNESSATIDFKEYMKLLTHELGTIYQKGNKVRSEIKTKGQTEFDIDTAIPLGLILNELISNAYKYAFDGKKEGVLSLSLESRGIGKYQLVVGDNGQGLPEAFDFKKTKSLGLKLVRRLSSQLYGKVAYNYDSGSQFTITFIDTQTRKSE